MKLVGWSAMLACGGPHQPEARPTPPAITTPTADAPAPVDASAEAPPPAPDPFADVKPACRGAALSFETEESEAECLISNEGSHELPPSPGADVLELTAVVDNAVPRGRTGTVMVTLTNKKTEPLLLLVDRTCDAEPLFPYSIYDASKKRVDLITRENCDTHTFGCTRRVMRIVLEPGGSLTRKHTFSTKVTKMLPDCREAVVGSLKPGNYQLWVVTGLDRHAEFASSRNRKWIETPFVVK